MLALGPAPAHSFSRNEPRGKRWGKAPFQPFFTHGCEETEIKGEQAGPDPFSFGRSPVPGAVRAVRGHEELSGTLRGKRVSERLWEARHFMELRVHYDTAEPRRFLLTAQNLINPRGHGGTARPCGTKETTVTLQNLMDHGSL
ncbi:hypothetical protein DUI87_33669 [Hirundo rustica rustica]|uniref:Uncharacterized protein n=1 Tax=Hirundo rustica rustica TaxID=333673 RepID=A0A3M0IMK1_HIRRU|nr:hypothetical protein DUI87_33669 [Hirundo rustica rustica]